MKVYFTKYLRLKFNLYTFIKEYAFEKKNKIIVINSGLGNIDCLISYLEFLNFDFEIKDKFRKGDDTIFDGFILLGVGSFPSGMKQIKNIKFLKISFLEA